MRFSSATDVIVRSGVPRWSLFGGERLELRRARGIELRCLSGLVWITEAGNPKDAWLQPGDAWTATRRGVVLISADADSVIEARSPRSKPASGAPWLRLLAAIRARQRESRAPTG